MMLLNKILSLYVMFQSKKYSIILIKMSEIKQLYFNKLKISFLKLYIQKHIKKLRKLQKQYIQIGGEKEDEKKEDEKKEDEKKEDEKKEDEKVSGKMEVEPIRVPLVSTFVHDAPNIIARSIDIFNNTSDLVDTGECLANKYDQEGIIKPYFKVANELLGFLKIFIRSYSFFIKMFKGQFNEKILKAIEDFENSLLEDVPEEKLPPEVAEFVKKHEQAHEMMKGGAPNENVEVSPEAAQELAAIMTVTKKLVDEVDKSGKIITREVLPDVLSRKINPMQQMNNAISDSIRAALDVAKAMPGVGAAVSAVSLLDKITKNADRMLSILETNVTIAQQIVEKNVVKTPDNRCSMPLLDAALALSKLGKQSPEVARLVKSVGIDILEDGVKNSLNPSDEYLDMNRFANFVAKDAIQTLDNSGEMLFDTMEKNKQEALAAVDQPKEETKELQKETQKEESKRASPPKKGGKKSLLKKSLFKKKRTKRRKRGYERKSPKKGTRKKTPK